ncbi:LysR family transcriptional regulator [Sporosarcina sp. ZBG7A]|uniref:LysR family transcriptional regulator n=1 Tax=Sporosarcina sp. ZBG7A TaxID=1582223 RepID=UPI00057B1980|nr:LysR family transcriptional regulator [Sporosarcina sp. ZBG7A]
MRFEQLNHLLFAVHYGSVTRAAEALFVTQSALSQSISRLEEELGVQLLVRTKKGVAATPDSHFFLEKSRLVVDALEEMRREAARLDENSKMRIGTVKGLHLNFLMPAFLSFKASFPHLSFEYEEAGSISIRNSVIKQNIDIGIAVLYAETLIPHEEICFMPIKRVNFFVLVGKDSLLARKPTISFEDISNESLVVYDGEFMNWFMEDLFKRNGNMNVLMRTNNVDTIRETISGGHAIAIETENEIYNPLVQGGQIISIPFMDSGIPEATLGLIYSVGKPVNGERKQIIQMLEKYISEWSALPSIPH